MRLSGYALHAGVSTAVDLTRYDGPLAFEQRGVRVALADAHVLRTDHGVTIGHPAGLRIDLVEHVLAAIGGLSIATGVLIAVDGPELPLLDGGAATFAEALRVLDVRSAAPRLRVTRRETLRHDDSVYHFVPAGTVDMGVTVAFAHPLIGTQEARWDGTRDAFVRAIAPARTFGFRAEAAALRQQHRALLSASPEGLSALERAVLVFDDAPSARGSALRAGPHEIARHKLLDLIGDFTLHGGPPLGQVFAERPGHGATHAIVASARASGLLSRA